MSAAKLFLVAGLLASGAYASPIQARTPYAVKDSHFVPSKWRQVAAAPSTHNIDLRIAVKQNQFTDLEKHLYEVSDPDHSRYGQHLSELDVKKLVQPSDDSLALVHEWLADNGIEAGDLSYSSSKDWIKVSLPVHRIESLLDTKYNVYRHEDGSETVRAPEWSLPLHLHEHIDTIQPTNSFFRSSPKAVSLEVNKFGGSYSQDVTYHQDPNVTAICTPRGVTPLCMRTLYETIDYIPQVSGKNKMSLVNYLGETNNRSDTYLFLEKFRPEAKETAYEFQFDVINNGSTSQAKVTSRIEIEGNLDVQTMLGFSYPVPLTAYTVGGSPEFIPSNGTTTNTNEPYLDWLQHILAQSDDTIPQVVSTSYDDEEQTVPASYAKRVCEDLAQLGARGVSVFYSSGDSGVGGSGSCVTNNGSNAKRFIPEFPSTCPYITSVGATMDFKPEVVAYHASGYASGGGFSDLFPRPAYQDKAVKAYLKGLGDRDAAYFNASGRAYPDIAGQGSYFSTVWNGTDTLVSGTSASTPLIAALVALVNDALLAGGKPTLGFLNPWLYKKGYRAFTDITSGSAVGCSEIGDGKGFPAVEGWDPVTGFGTPKFRDIIHLLGVHGYWNHTGGWS
ncbi:subtilisin-like protein [Aureobasidium pullulans]|uniref:tripeptidyl-peptidase II n=1 Tax=Aureobasidium pullulans TaxID=5580 RepID=A0A4T0BE05_AURPU|nr:subtilisin-like protein [Aureobasidium pullulans]